MCDRSGGEPVLQFPYGSLHHDLPHEQAPGTAGTSAFHQRGKRGRAEKRPKLSGGATFSEAFHQYSDEAGFARVATIQDIADHNFSLSIPLYVKQETEAAEVDTRSVQEHFDSWMAASETMKLSYEKLNLLLGKGEQEDE